MKMTPEQLEFAISQYLDGTLAPLERDVLDERLATDADARALLEEYRSLDAALKSGRPAPAIEWDRLHRHLAESIAQVEAPAIRNYTMPWLRNLQGVAIAASVLLVVGLGIQSYRSHLRIEPRVAQTQIAVVGPQSEAASVLSVIEVAIGPAPASDEQNWRYADSIIGRATVVLIDRADGPAQDIDPMPY